MDLHLNDKVAVVSGGSRGIGLATVKQLRAEGMQVLAGSRRSTPELEAAGAAHLAVDLTTAEGPERLVADALARFGRLDVLVNNVGVGDTDDQIQGVLHDLTTLGDDAWRHAFDLHFYSALRAIRAALPALVEHRGVVVNVSATGARLVAGGPVDSNVAKAALNALTKLVSEQFGPNGVRAITVSPGPTRTGVWTDADGMVARLAAMQGVDRDAFAAKLIEGSGAATGRMSEPEEVARAIAFAASPNNITGSELLVDGGIIKHA
jgi:NAD(P)-dependent dehydrogenase (short-subunit alcohol dehydrogenase family)